MCLQASEENLVKQSTDLKKYGTLLTHHMGGSVMAKKRFEAMLGA